MAEFESLAGAEPLAKHLQRHRTDRLIMLSDGIFAIATTLAALEVRVPEHAGSLSQMLAESRQSLGAYFLSFLFTAVFWITNRELFARVAKTDAWLTVFTLASLCGIAIIPAGVHIFYTPGGLEAGFKFYCLIMIWCGVTNAAMWIYAAARRGVLRSEVGPRERWARALPTLIMPVMFVCCLFLDKSQLSLVLVPVAVAIFLARRVIMPRFWSTKAVDSAT